MTQHFSISKYDEYYLPSINRNTFEKLDSSTLYQQRFEESIFKPDTLHVIIGLDSGLLANYILERALPEGSKYVFVELESVLQLLTVDIPSHLHDKFSVLDSDGFFSYLESGIDDLYIVKDQCIVHNSLASIAPYLEDYSYLNNRINKKLENRALEQKVGFSQKIFFKQQLMNCSENRSPASILRDSFIGKTCIVIGGGPSLDDDLEWIEANYHDLFIITVSRIAAKLSKAKIPAHIIVSVDPQDVSFEVNREMMALSNESIFINSYHVNHRLISQWLGKSLYLGQNLPWIKDDIDNIETVGPTVTNSAVRIAIELGFKQILLTGADFCYSSSGVTHSSGTIEAKSGPNLNRIGEWVQTYAGETAETIIQLIYAAQALEEEAVNNPNVEIINLSKNAAMIKGVAHKNRESIIIESAKCSPKDLLELVPSSTDATTDFLQTKLLQLNKARNALTAISELANDAISINKLAKSSFNNQKKHHTYTQKIEKIEKRLNDNFSDFTQIIKFYGYFEFSKFLTTKEQEKWSAEHMNQMTHHYYKAFESLSVELLPYIIQALERLKSRIEEQAISPNLEILSQQWLKDDQPGRVRILKQHGALKENTDIFTGQRAVELENNYQDQLVSFEHSYFSAHKRIQSLHNTHIKILELFRSKNKAGLTQLSNNLLKPSKNDTYAERMYRLSRSYNYILQDKHQPALDELLILNEELKTETELKQILLIALKLLKLDLVEGTLEKIILLNDEYCPQYAHILKLQGKTQKALDTYLDYLDKYPTDVTVLLKLGIFLTEVEQMATAKTVFEQVLEVSPDNLTAKNYIEQLS